MLFQELNLEPPPSIWGSLPKTDTEKLFSEIYIRQTKDIWNTPEASSLLKSAASAAPKLSTKSTHSVIEVNLDVARYVYLDGTRELMTLLPRELLYREPNSDSDPLPPSKENNIFSHRSQMLPFEGVNNADRGLDDQNNLLQAMADLLPQWMRVRAADGDWPGGPNEDDLIDSEYEEDEGEDDEMPGGFPDGADDDEPGQGRPRPSGFLSLLERMFATGRFAGPGIGDEDEDEEDTDTDDELPPLVGLGGTEPGEEGVDTAASDDEMPALV